MNAAAWCSPPLEPWSGLTHSAADFCCDGGNQLARPPFDAVASGGAPWRFVATKEADSTWTVLDSIFGFRAQVEGRLAVGLSIDGRAAADRRPTPRRSAGVRTPPAARLLIQLRAGGVARRLLTNVRPQGGAVALCPHRAATIKSPRAFSARFLEQTRCRFVQRFAIVAVALDKLARLVERKCPLPGQKETSKVPPSTR